jgi:hypothetical protein
MTEDLLHLIVKERAPPDNFRYTFREDGHRIKSFHYYGWLRLIKKHYQDNQYPMPDDWVEIAEDQVCRLLPPGHCEYDNGEQPEYFVNTRFGLEDAINGTKALMAWTVSGFPLVSREVAEERGACCAACYANVNVPGCTSCVQFAGLVADVVGIEPLKSDTQLLNKVCAFCKCATRAHVWLPASVLRTGVSDEALAAMPSWCFKKKAIAELEQTA